VTTLVGKVGLDDVGLGQRSTNKGRIDRSACEISTTQVVRSEILEQKQGQGWQEYRYL
jgi:hypothetical protein